MRVYLPSKVPPISARKDLSSLCLLHRHESPPNEFSRLSSQLSSRDEKTARGTARERASGRARDSSGEEKNDAPALRAAIRGVGLRLLPALVCVARASPQKRGAGSSRKPMTAARLAESRLLQLQAHNTHQDSPARAQALAHNHTP